jgi:hypothetical protein
VHLRIVADQQPIRVGDEHEPDSAPFEQLRQPVLHREQQLNACSAAANHGKHPQTVRAGTLDERIPCLQQCFHRSYCDRVFRSARDPRHRRR